MARKPISECTREELRAFAVAHGYDLPPNANAQTLARRIRDAGWEHSYITIGQDDEPAPRASGQEIMPKAVDMSNGDNAAIRAAYEKAWAARAAIPPGKDHDNPRNNLTREIEKLGRQLKVRVRFNNADSALHDPVVKVSLNGRAQVFPRDTDLDMAWDVYDACIRKTMRRVPVKDPQTLKIVGWKEVLSYPHSVSGAPQIAA